MFSSVFNHKLGQSFFANFTFKLIKVIISCSTKNLFFDFGKHPFFKTLNVNVFTTSRTFARAEEEILIGSNILHAYFADRSMFYFYIHVFIFGLTLQKGESAWFTDFFLFINLHLNNRVFNSSKFNFLSNF